MVKNGKAAVDSAGEINKERDEKDVNRRLQITEKRQVV
jgi:hypothetical protein